MTSASDPDTDTDTDADDNEDDEDNDESLELLAQPFWDSIVTRVSSYSRDSPPSTADFTTFKSFWRDRFDQMREELFTAQEANLFITSPPIRALEIEILDYNRNAQCPCCLPDAEADIVIRAEGGITGEIFLNAVRSHLYGESLGKRDVALRGVYRGGLLVRGWDYMLQPDGILYGGNYTGNRIWMYCSGDEKGS
ncbi:hypothetical protein IMSHALPRED_001585 [Imshaugia aleurites]|uniref:Uncharacterized protein n=1 Tax=Imshaugia aleurites TaxID=172621 RepID=A0A8H3J2R9_9LECA|nr:hypothetical protein IMSHALPRED_001585 [Imshaugia aleurites]